MDAGARMYSCGPGCPQPDLPAERVESDLLLCALIRGAVAATDCAFVGPAVTGEEMMRWERCDARDRRAIVRAAYLRVDVTEYGRLWPVWRHLSDQPAVGVARVPMAPDRRPRPVPTPIRLRRDMDRASVMTDQPGAPEGWPVLAAGRWWEPR